MNRPGKGSTEPHAGQVGEEFLRAGLPGRTFVYVEGPTGNTIRYEVNESGRLVGVDLFPAGSAP